MKKKITLVRLLFWACISWATTFFVLPLTYSQSPGHERAITVNVMALRGTTGLSLVKMLHDSPSLEENVTTNYTLIKSPDQIVSKILSGEADIAALPTNLAAVLYNKGVKIRLLAITNWGVTYIVGRDKSVQSWSDLKGKNIAVTGQGATPDILFRLMVKANGLNPEKDFTIRYYPTPVELAHLVIAGKEDLAVLPEPWTTEVITRDLSTEILLDFQEEWKKAQNQGKSYPQSCLVVNALFAKEHPEVVSAFLKTASASSEWVNKNPSQAAGLAETYISIKAEAGRLAIPRCNLYFVKAEEVREEIEYYLRTLHKFNPKSIGERIPDADFYQ